MEEIKNVMALFDSKDKWNAFIELSNMRTELVNEMKDRLIIELKKIAESSLTDAGWIFDANYDYIKMYPIGSNIVGVVIEWRRWNEPWSRRGACIWFNRDDKSIDWPKVYDKIKTNKNSLHLQDYGENIQNHGWFPFVKQIPAKVFDVENDTTSVEKCLYMAKDHASQLATNLWEEVYKPFANKEIADLMRSFVKE